MPGDRTADGDAPEIGQPPGKVVLIYFDDLNAWIGPMRGYPGVRTPNLDRLASSGVTFQNAYCTVPVCNASRCSLLLSRYPHETGIYGNSEWIWDHAGSQSLVEAFREAGYRTVGRGKIFHKGTGEEGREKAGKDTSRPVWDDYWSKSDRPLATGGRSGRGPYAHAEESRRPGRYQSFDWGPASEDEADYIDPAHVDSAIEAVKASGDEPTLLAVGFEETHIPWYAPSRFFDLYPLDGVHLPSGDQVSTDELPQRIAEKVRNERDDHRLIEGHGLWKEAIQAYLATISFVDHEIGRLLDAVNRHVDPSDTLVVAVGDHGWHLGEKLAWRKATLWEEATRVPLLLAGSGIARGADCRRVVSLVDVFPTLAEVCGLSPQDRLSGLSFRPLLHEPGRRWDRIALTTLKRHDHAVRSEHYRYIRYRDGSEELYDHRDDPMETRNVARQASYRQVARSLAREIPSRAGRRRRPWARLARLLGRG